MVYNSNIEDIMIQIKHIMLDKQLRQSDIVESTNWSKATVSNLLNSKSKNITLDTLQAICEAIDCQLVINIVPMDKD